MEPESGFDPEEDVTTCFEPEEMAATGLEAEEDVATGLEAEDDATTGLELEAPIGFETEVDFVNPGTLTGPGTRTGPGSSVFFVMAAEDTGLCEDVGTARVKVLSPDGGMRETTASSERESSV